MAEHTPGPWVVKGEPDLLCVTDADSRYIVDRFILGDWPPEERLANARLIAASPDMFAELQRLEQWFGDKCDFGVLDRCDEYQWWFTTQALIAKATNG